jgi:hypothetical protein
MAEPKKPERKIEVELHPDAWPRFERFIKQIAKAGPQHRVAKKKRAPPSKKAKNKTTNA